MEGEGSRRWPMTLVLVVGMAGTTAATDTCHNFHMVIDRLSTLSRCTFLSNVTVQARMGAVFHSTIRNNRSR